MNREIRLLEFDKIIAMLAGGTVTPMGAELAEDLLPTARMSVAVKWQKETTEAVSAQKRSNISLQPVADSRRSLELAAVGSMLGEEQLFSILSFLQATAKLKKTFLEKDGYPILRGLVEQMESLALLREELKKSLSEEGQLKDQASPDLFRLRRSIAAGERDLRDKFDRFIKNPANQKILQESLVTVRGDRFVVPVRLEYRAQVPGVVYDQSASGATLFVEPLWAVDANNRLSILRQEEEREREKILIRLSQWVGAEHEALLHSLNLYAELDFIMAKGKLSLAMNAGEPQLNDRGILRIKKGYHPLLTGEVVPISLEMDRSLRTLVITGPNTGGKTVTLKTVGLLALMAQSGLHVPAAEGCEMAVFPKIFADIGDEQSIAQSLSTFSGHLINIIEIIRNLEPGSLVLLDEVGAGTDPAEGAGLAMALLEYLHRRQAVTVATTHYSQLKAFAHLTEGMENASVEFDVNSLRPTYQLLVGVPGISHAFSIASRLGLADEIIIRGREFLSQEETRLEEVITDLVADRRKAEIAARQAEADLKQTRLLLLQIQNEKEHLEQRKNEILDKARLEAHDLLSRTKRESQNILKQLKKIAFEPIPAKNEVAEAEKRLQDLDEEISVPPAQPAKGKSLALTEIRPGLEVMLANLKQPATVMDVAADGRVEVLAGSMRLQVDASDVLQLSQKKAKAKSREHVPLYTADYVPAEVDLHGQTVDEAIYLLENYLDKAAAAGIKEVRLVHGRGTGRLRAGVQDYLRGHRRVVSYRLAPPAEGGVGATIVTLKQPH